jgi:carbamoyltransferase
VDGFGDFVGAMWGVGRGHSIEIKERIFFPHSLGLYYLALTQFLGFRRYGDEYKVMGLAAFGEPSERAKMQQVVRLHPHGRFELDLRFFNHHSEGVAMTWEGGEPSLGPVYSKDMEDLFGPARASDDPIERRHENLAASLQTMYEEAFFHFLNGIYDQTQSRRLCLAGGCAMNSVANGKVFDRTPFEEIYIQAAAGDAGGALGAACYVWNQELNKPRDFVMDHVYWGPCFSSAEIGEALRSLKQQLTEEGCTIERFEDRIDLCQKAAGAIADGKIVGWFQGRMEWGPRALGNRSILADPRRADMKDVLNQRIKNREAFRPFAPSVLLEKAGAYFEKDYPDPFMLKVYPVRPDKRAEIPAVTHVDGTGRLQTVKREDNPLYWQLIREFERLTGVPVVLNTSFNENEPIVCTPREAMDCFLRTKMDVLFIGEYVVRKRGNAGMVE